MSAENDPLVNVAAEAVTLGAMMLENSLLVDLADRLRAEDFDEPVHQRIYSAMLRMTAKGKRADAVSLRPVFALDKDCDNGTYLDVLVDSPAAVVGGADLAAQVMDLAIRRRARDAMRDGISQIEDIDVAVGDVIGTVEERVWAAERVDDDDEPADVADLLDTVLGRQESIDRGEQKLGAENKLISDLDFVLGPLEQGTYTIIAGRPGMGKTALASSAALGYALNQNHGLYLGTEMSKVQHGMRVISDLSHAFGHRIMHANIKKGVLDNDERHWLNHVRERAKLLPLRFKHIGACNWRRVYSIVAREKARLAAIGKTLWFVVIDYLGMLQAEGADGRLIDDDRKRMNAVSAGMMRIRDELGVAVIGLAQLSRKVDERPNKRPHNADLKETGNLEQDADAILFAYREEYYLEQEKPKPGDKPGRPNGDPIEEWETELRAVRGKLEIIAGKNRHDARRSKDAKFFGDYYAVRGSGYSDAPGMDEFEFA
jgi:replicative DNA helicase